MSKRGGPFKRGLKDQARLLGSFNPFYLRSILEDQLGSPGMSQLTELEVFGTQLKELGSTSWGQVRHFHELGCSVRLRTHDPPSQSPSAWRQDPASDMVRDSSAPAASTGQTGQLAGAWSMELVDWYPVPTVREDVGSTAAGNSFSPSDEEWPPMPALVPITRSVVPAGWRVDRDAPSRLRYWDGQRWTQYATLRTTPQTIPSLKRTRATGNRPKAWLTALGVVLLIVALIAVVLPHNNSSAERAATRVSPTTTLATSGSQQSSPTTNVSQSVIPPPVTSSATSATQPTSQPTPAVPATSPSSSSSISASPKASKFTSDLTQVGDDETAIANNAGTAESSGNLTQVGTECGILSTQLGTLQGDTVPNILTPIEQTALTNIVSDLTNAANDCTQGVRNHNIGSIIAAINLFSSAGSLINQLDSQLS
jgi:hypothetical protein